MLTRKKKVLFSVLLLAVLCLLVEALFYVYIYHIKDNPLGDASERNQYTYFRGHALNPDYHRAFDTGGKRIHSPDGFRRDEPVSVAKPDGVYRIILFGGSQAYGVGAQHGGVYPAVPSLQNDQTVSHYLEAALNQALDEAGRSTKVEVINAAVIAYKVYQHLLYFNERLYQYDADLLVFLDGHNDFYSDEVARNPMLENVYAKDLVWHFNQRSLTFALYSMARSLGQYSYFFKLCEKSLQSLMPWLSPYESPMPVSSERGIEGYNRYARDNYMRIYQQFGALSPLYGFQMHLLIQPEILLEDATQLSPHDQQIHAITEKHGDSDLMKAIHARLPSVFADVGFPVTDVTALAPDNSTGDDLYFDYTHLTPAGSRLLANRMAASLWPDLSRSAD